MNTYSHALEPMLFNYALRFPSGLFYTGRVTSDSKPDYDRGEKSEAFTYTQEGAYRKIQSTPDYWKGVEVVRID